MKRTTPSAIMYAEQWKLSVLLEEGKNGVDTLDG